MKVFTLGIFILLISTYRINAQRIRYQVSIDKKRNNGVWSIVTSTVPRNINVRQLIGEIEYLDKNDRKTITSQKITFEDMKLVDSIYSKIFSLPKITQNYSARHRLKGIESLGSWAWIDNDSILFNMNNLENDKSKKKYYVITDPPANGNKTVTVGGDPMYPSKNLIENAVNSKDHTTLVAAVKAAGLVETLSGAGPFTVFAPTNKAFDKLPRGTVETLVKPDNKETLTRILTYHVVPGKMSAADLMKAISNGGGKATLYTLSGGTLTAMQKGRKIELIDAQGGTSTITIADVFQSNGVIHVIDTVLIP